MLLLYLFGIALLVQYYGLRKRPLSLHGKLKRSIEVYEIMIQQIEGVETRMNQLSAHSMEETLVHMQQRHEDLRLFIRGQSKRYSELYNHPLKRRLLVLPPPPEFKC